MMVILIVSPLVVDKCSGEDRPVNFEELDNLQIELESALTKLAKREGTLDTEISVLDAATSGQTYFERFKGKPSPSKQGSRRNNHDEDGSSRAAPKRSRDADSDYVSFYGHGSNAVSISGRRVARNVVSFITWTTDARKKSFFL